MSIGVRQLNKQFRVHVRGAGWAEKVDSLFKREYRIVEAVKDVLFSIQSGEIINRRTRQEMFINFRRSKKRSVFLREAPVLLIQLLLLLIT